VASTMEPWKPSHSDVINHLRDNLGKLGIRVVYYLTEVRLHIGQDMTGHIDLVTVGGYRTRGDRQGNVLCLFEVKAEPSQLFRVVLRALQQIDMYSLALEHPSLFVVGEDKIEKLSNSLAYQQYLVIQEALWDEQADLSESDLERLQEILDSFDIGIITYNSKWKFKLDKYWGKPGERETPYLAKTVKRKKKK